MSAAGFESAPGEVARVAAEWFARLQEDEVSEQDFAEWQRWLTEHPDHHRIYREIEEAWNLIGEVQPVPWSPAEGPEARSPGKPEARTAPAEAPERGEMPSAWAQPQAPAPRSRAKRPWAIAAILLTVAGIVSGALFMEWPASKAYSTSIAEQRSVRLPDGSRVTLGAHSRLTPRFDGSTRQVELTQGQAFFEVTHDPARPFTVLAGASEIRAIGTSFDVRAAPSRVLVSVTEGRVAVRSTHLDDEANGQKLFLSAGEHAAIDRAGRVEQNARMTTNISSWRQGRFEYRGEELRYIVEDLNRYTDRPIILADDSVASLRYSGTVFPDHLDEWLEGISGALPVIVRESDSSREIVRAR